MAEVFSMFSPKPGRRPTSAAATPAEKPNELPEPEPAAQEVEKNIILTKDQENAWAAIDREVFRGETACAFSLRGTAGSGKTWLTGQLVKHYLKIFPNRHQHYDHESRIATYPVACAAATNKAVQAMKALSPVAKNPNVWFGTLHSFLGLRPVLDEKTGKEHFKPDKNITEKKVSLLVVDEASMTSAELHRMTNLLTFDGTSILYVGDHAQLPPVGESLSPALSEEKSATLIEIVRHGSAIQTCVNAMRDAVLNNTMAPMPVTDIFEGEGVITASRDDWLASLLKDFKSPEYAENSDFVRAIAWTNRAVDWGNTMVHAALYGADAPRFMPGQTLVAAEPVFSRDGAKMNSDGTFSSQIRLANSDECEVVKAELLDGDFRSGFSKHWRITVSIHGVNYELFVIEPSDRNGFDRKLKELKDIALWTKTPGFDKSGAWRDYFRVREAFADLRPCYWSTAHKSQGSQMERVYIATGDIMSNRNQEERNRLLYTAYTRAVTQLCILV